MVRRLNPESEISPRETEFAPQKVKKIIPKQNLVRQKDISNVPSLGEGPLKIGKYSLVSTETFLRPAEVVSRLLLCTPPPG